MISILKYILFFYSILGMLIAGGILFNRKQSNNIFLGVFILILSVKQLNFLYSSSELSQFFPQFIWLTLPGWFLLGPLLYFYVYSYGRDWSMKWQNLLHFIPLGLLSIYIFYMFRLSGVERIHYIRQNFDNIVMPINFAIAFHISLYAVWMILVVRKKILPPTDKYYLGILVFIYVLTVLLESYLTVFAETYQWFVYYFIAASTLTLYVGYLLIYRPHFFDKWRKKYGNSALPRSKARLIISKFELHFLKQEIFTDRQLSLSLVSQQLEIPKHQISQSLSMILHTTFNEYLNKRRIEYAKKIIGQRPKILAVALDAGFTNKSTFYRAFKKYTGQTPNEFKRSIQ